MPVTAITKDLDNRTLTITADFAAPVTVRLPTLPAEFSVPVLLRANSPTLASSGRPVVTVGLSAAFGL